MLSKFWYSKLWFSLRKLFGHRETQMVGPAGTGKTLTLPNATTDSKGIIAPGWFRGAAAKAYTEALLKNNPDYQPVFFVDESKN